jgi:hypothetical protein
LKEKKETLRGGNTEGKRIEKETDESKNQGVENC